MGMSKIETFNGELSRADLQALKQASKVSFHSNWSDGGNSKGTHRIDMTMEGKVFDSERALYLDTAYLNNYGDSLRGEEVSAFAMQMTARFNDNWQTVVGLLRVGDVVSLKWTRANDSESLREAQMSRDTLDFVVTRKNKTMTFRIDTCVCPVNSLARMIRRTEDVQVSR